MCLQIIQHTIMPESFELNNCREVFIENPSITCFIQPEEQLELYICSPHPFQIKQTELWGIFQHQQFSDSPDISWTTRCCPLIHFNSDTTYLGLSSNSTGLKAQSHKSALMSDTSHQDWDPSLPMLLSNLAKVRQFPKTSSLSGLMICWKGSKNSGRQFMFTGLL